MRTIFCSSACLIALIFVLSPGARGFAAGSPGLGAAANLSAAGQTAQAGGSDAGQASENQPPSQAVWDSSFDGQFKALIAAAANNFASVVKDGDDGPEVDLDLTVLDDTDTCGYVQGGLIGAPVCIFQFDAGQDQGQATKSFKTLMAHIGTLLPGWKEKKPDSEGQGMLDQFITEHQSVKCSMEWSDGSGSYAIIVNFVGHPLPKPKPHRERERHENHKPIPSTTQPAG